MAEETHQPEFEPEMDVDEEWEEDEVFYEKIEAPKFVDFSTPDHYRPDDRYWFCLRVGCDQKHEEEMDSEKIYKDFVLRVMAARSPNVRLQKALSRHAAGKNIKCPLTVPAKSSKSRLSRLAAVSNISRKLIEDKEKISLPSKPTSTPKIRGKQVASKYLTTPRNKRCIPNRNSFRSVQNPKPAGLAVPKNSRTIAKALVFQSPKKAISLMKSVELRTPLTKLCQGIKKLEITDQKKRLQNYSGKLKYIKCNARDPLRNRISQKDKHNDPKNTGKSQTCVPREARPVHSTNIQNQAKLDKQCHSKNMAENECSKPEVDLTLKDKNKDHKNTGKSQMRVPREARPVHSTNIQNQAKLDKQCHSKNMEENECSKPEVNLTLKDRNKELLTASDNLKDSKQPEANVCSALQSTKNLDLASSDAMTDELNCDADHNDLVGNDHPQSQLLSGEDHNGTELNTMDHSICSQISEEAGDHHSECMRSDDKENATVPDENRCLTNNINQAGQKVLGVQKMQKVIKNAQPASKNLKEGLLSTNAGASGMKPKKPKPTNPKPFRLRTDERGILREVDLQRKKQGNVEYPDNKNRFTEDNPEGNERDSKGLRNGLSASVMYLKKESRIKSNKTPEGKVRLKKSSKTPERSHATQVRTANLRIANSPMASCLKQGQQLTVIQEASAEISKPNKVGKRHENGSEALPRAKALTPSRMLSRGRPLTIPKEPHFHSIHRPKSCTRNLVEQVPL